MHTRRQFLGGISAAAVCLHASAAPAPRADHSIEIAPCTLELSPKRRLRTVAYNGIAPGALLRLREGESTTVDVTNRSSVPEIVHWHGLRLPSIMDGAMEEGAPMIAPGATLRYTLSANPPGCRWYHTHTFAGGDTSRGQYTGQHGILYVEPKNNPGDYDAEHFLVLEDWSAHMMGSDDGAMSPTYDVSTVNGKSLGFGDPVRVKQGNRLLLHIVNASATDTHWVALAGHSFRVLALDGNPVPQQQTVSMLRLTPAERVSAIVECNNAGKWIFGEVRRHIREAGMGLVLEYAESAGGPQWQQPSALQWNYEQFGKPTSTLATIAEIPLIFASKFKGHGAPEQWTINGKSYPDVASPKLEAGKLYRLRLINRSVDDHPIHLHRHTFQIAGTGIRKDTVLVPANSEISVDFLADNPGPTLLHCHQQDHMDYGFMMVFQYA